MKQFLLATVLIALPIGAFTAFQIYTQSAPAVAAEASLGDLSPLKVIVADTESIVAKGDMVAAEKRITDFESLWDEDQATMQPLNKAAWGTVDDAADAAIHSLRSKAPDAAKVTAALAGLASALDNPSGGAVDASVKMISGIAVTDETGHALPCETMIKPLQAQITAGSVKAENLVSVKDFLIKATERCNADDDAHADEFSAQALALAAK